MEDMTPKIAETIIQELKKKDIVFEKGLTDDEIASIQKLFNIIFPPDLTVFLQTALPVSEKFVNWRRALLSEREQEHIVSRLEWPVEGILFDISNDKFWPESWNSKPPYLEDQFEVAKQHFSTYPTLVPIYSHRYIPSSPLESGNPVFSVYQSDIICYGNDLAAYFSNEFKFDMPDPISVASVPKEIPFWTTCVNMNNS